MEPALTRNKKVRFVFQIGSDSEWIGIGICNKNIIQKKNYQFNYSAIGHGAYMISSNGGSWSSTDNYYNNIIKSFKFYEEDIIICDYDPIQHIILFTNQITNE